MATNLAIEAETMVELHVRVPKLALDTARELVRARQWESIDEVVAAGIMHAEREVREPDEMLPKPGEPGFESFKAMLQERVRQADAGEFVTIDEVCERIEVARAKFRAEQG